MCKFINWSDHYFTKYTNKNFSKILIMSILTIWVTVSSHSKLGTREHSRWCRIDGQWSVKLSAHTSRRPCWILEVWGRHARMQPYQMIYQFVGHALGPADITDIPLIKSAPEHDYWYIQPKCGIFKKKKHLVPKTPVALFPDNNRPLQWVLDCGVTCGLTSIEFNNYVWFYLWRP